MSREEFLNRLADEFYHQIIGAFLKGVFIGASFVLFIFLYFGR
jgi:hypothetical protein